MVYNQRSPGATLGRVQMPRVGVICGEECPASRAGVSVDKVRIHVPVSTPLVHQQGVLTACDETPKNLRILGIGLL